MKKDGLVLVCVVLGLGVFEARADTLFVSDFRNVHRVELPSGAVTTIVANMVNVSDGGCDAVGRIYFATESVGEIWRWNQDGTDQTDIVPAAGNVGCPESPSFDCEGNLYFNECLPLTGWFLKGADPSNAAFPVVTLPDTVTGEGSAIVRGGPHQEALLLVAAQEQEVWISEPPGAPPSRLISASSFHGLAAFGVETNELGEIFVAAGDVVLRFDPEGVFIEDYASGLVNAQFLDFDSDGNLYVADQSQGVWRVALDGTQTLFAAIDQAKGIAVCRDRRPSCPGACCDGLGGCTVVDMASCTGSYQGDGTTCDAGASCGACCSGAGCTDTIAASCADVFIAGAGCADTPDPCGPTTGACCDGSGGCTVTESASCAGTYQGDLTVCDGGETCGACCSAVGCSDTTSSACADTFIPGAGCSDTPDPCIATTGACCDGSGGCTITDSGACTGTFQGTGTDCDAGTCGACCTPGGCTDSIAAACSDPFDPVVGCSAARDPCGPRLLRNTESPALLGDIFEDPAACGLPVFDGSVTLDPFGPDCRPEDSIERPAGDDDDTYLKGFASGSTDPEGGILTDETRPLVFYQVDRSPSIGNDLRLLKDLGELSVEVRF